MLSSDKDVRVIAPAGGKVWFIYENTTEKEVWGQQNKSRSTNRSSEMTFRMWVNQSESTWSELWLLGLDFSFDRTQVYQVCLVELG